MPKTDRHLLRLLRIRHRAFVRVHQRLRHQVARVADELQGRGPQFMALELALRDALAGSLPGAGLEALSGPGEAPEAPTLAPQAGEALTKPQREALKLARNAVQLRAVQLAACRTCGVEAAAYQQAVSELDRLLG